MSHAKAKRKGGMFASPSSKSEQKLTRQLLTLHLVVVIYLVTTRSHFVIIHDTKSQVWPRKGSSMDVMETLPLDIDMPDFDMANTQLGQNECATVTSINRIRDPWLKKQNSKCSLLFMVK